MANARTWQVGAAIGLAALLALGWYRPFGSNDAAMTIRAGMAVPLTAYPGFEQAPSLSPDGSQVAFSWNGPRQDNYDIYVKLVGPGEPVQLTQNAAPDENPAWSPNGDRIAFLRRASENSAELFTVPALRGAENRIATISPEYGRNRPFNNLSWTPDGKWLAFGGALSPDGGARGIWLIAADGVETRRLTEAPAGEGVGDFNPVWSPDGRQMAFLREQTINGAAVFVLPLTSDWRPNGPPTQVSSESSGVLALAWLPDARGLLFSWGGHGAPTRLRQTSISPRAGWNRCLRIPAVWRPGDRTEHLANWPRRLFGSVARCRIVRDPTVGHVTGENPGGVFVNVRRTHARLFTGWSASGLRIYPIRHGRNLDRKQRRDECAARGPRWADGSARTRAGRPTA